MYSDTVIISLSVIEMKWLCLSHLAVVVDIIVIIFQCALIVKSRGVSP